MKKIAIAVLAVVACTLAFALPAFADPGDNANENAGFGAFRVSRNDAWPTDAPGQTMKIKAQDDQGPGASWWVGKHTDAETERDHPGYPVE